MLLIFTDKITQRKVAISALQVSAVYELEEGIEVAARVAAGSQSWIVAETIEGFCARAEASLIDARTTFTGKLPKKKRAAPKKAVVKKAPARVVALKKAVAKVKAPAKKKAVAKKKAPAKVKKK